MTPSSVTWRWACRAALLAVGVLLVRFAQGISESATPGANPFDYLVGKGMETTPKLCVNGYLGQFFRFSMQGGAAWLGLLLAGGAIASVRSLSRPEAGLALAVALLATVIALKGTINYRYQATLVPIFIILGFPFADRIWRSGDADTRGAARAALIVALLGSVLYQVDRSWAQFVSSEALRTFVPGRILEDVGRVAQTKGSLLVCNESALYYFTDLHGLYYSEVAQDPRVGVTFGIFLPHSRDLALSKLAPRAAARHLRHELGLKHALVTDGMLYFDLPLYRLLNSAGRLRVYEPPYRLYDLAASREDWMLPEHGVKLLTSSGFGPPPDSADRIVRGLDRPLDIARSLLPIERPAYLELDLGRTRAIAELGVEFLDPNYSASHYTWQTRNAEAAPWVTQVQRTRAPVTEDRHAFPAPIEARFLRLELTAAPHPWGFIVRRLHAYGPDEPGS